MRLPNAHRALIDHAKVANYLLSFDHPVGHHKARFFVALGFEVSRPQELADALREVGRNGTVTGRVETQFGDKYIVDGAIISPECVRTNVRTVSMISAGQRAPRFVTVFPLG
jgi:Domain of unknown function (DUF6883)